MQKKPDWRRFIDSSSTFHIKFMSNYSKPAPWLACTVSLMVHGCAMSYTAMPSPPMTSMTPKGFTVLALSRGTGVPQTTWDTFIRIEALLESARQEGVNLRISRDKIGLEGETRLCVEFADPNLGEQFQQRIQEMAQGIELINVTNESCNAKP
ncbi:MAG: hypothetical protein ACKN9W_17320 [Methylococcus sp.]